MLRSWTFQKKLWAVFAVTVTLCILTASIAVYALRTVVAAKDQVLERQAQALIEAARLQSADSDQAAGFRGYLATLDTQLLKERKDAEEKVAVQIANLRQVVFTDEGKALLAEIEKFEAEVSAAQEHAIAVRAGRNGLEPALRLEGELIPRHREMAAAIARLVEREQRFLDNSKAESTARASMSTNLLVVVSSLAVLFAVVAAFGLGRSLTRQIGSAIQHIQSSSAELQTSASQQATGARETATTMTEVTTSMAELLASSRQITESALQVARIAEETASAARSGDQVVAKSQEAMESTRRQVAAIVGHMLELGKKAQLIGGVLDLINELAEQTNILSINASIEAAGAGEQGKRFAVVGDEIRKLADRVSGSIREIRNLVDDIRSAVNTTVLATETGSKAVDAGLHQFEEVTSGFKHIAGMVVTTAQAAREIELSTKQQASAVEQVTSAISGAAEASRDAEASSTQTLQTATQLSNLSRELSFLVQAHAAA